jgi:hypothetical protein
MIHRLIEGAILAVLLSAARANLQALAVEPKDWDRLVGHAEQVFACRAADQKSFPDPVAAALELIQRAIAAVDQSTSESGDTRALRGSFRANAVKRVEEIAVRQTAWKLALDQATKLHAKAQQDQAKAVLEKAELPACWEAPQALLGNIEQARQALDKQFKESTRVLERAQASFDLKAGAKLFQEAITGFTQAQTRNVEDQRPTKLVAEAKAQLANITAPAKYEVVVVTDPGGARVVLTGGEEKKIECPATPCKFKFEEAYFRRSGGSFLDSKRLLTPVVAEISKEGHKTATMRLSEGSGVWRASVLGKKIQQDYYYFTKRKFDVRLPAR